MSAIAEDHVPPLSDDFSGRSDGLPSVDFLPGLGPELNDGVVAADDSSPNVRVRVHSGTEAIKRCPMIAVLNSGNPHSFILESSWKPMVTSDVSDSVLESRTASRVWGGFGKHEPLTNPT